MTTAVTIDAHAGWPVRVVSKQGEPGQLGRIQEDIIQPGTQRTFYLHSGMHIILVEEMPNA